MEHKFLNFLTWAFLIFAFLFLFLYNTMYNIKVTDVTDYGVQLTIYGQNFVYEYNK